MRTSCWVYELTLSDSVVLPLRGYCEVVGLSARFHLEGEGLPWEAPNRASSR
jgi:hypothetical protein